MRLWSKKVIISEPELVTLRSAAADCADGNTSDEEWGGAATEDVGGIPTAETEGVMPTAEAEGRWVETACVGKWRTLERTQGLVRR